MPAGTPVSYDKIEHDPPDGGALTVNDTLYELVTLVSTMLVTTNEKTYVAPPTNAPA